MLLAEHAEELRADFRRVYDRDLLDLYRGQMSLFEATSLAHSLPPGSAVWRAEGGYMAWTDEAHILSVVERNTHLVWWLKTKDGQRKGAKPPKPLEPPPSKSQLAAAEAKANRVLHRQKARAATRARLNN